MPFHPIERHRKAPEPVERIIAAEAEAQLSKFRLSSAWPLEEPHHLDFHACQSRRIQDARENLHRLGTRLNKRRLLIGKICYTSFHHPERVPEGETWAQRIKHQAGLLRLDEVAVKDCLDNAPLIIRDQFTFTPSCHTPREWSVLFQRNATGLDTPVLEVNLTKPAPPLPTDARAGEPFPVSSQRLANRQTAGREPWEPPRFIFLPGRDADGHQNLLGVAGNVRGQLVTTRPPPANRAGKRVTNHYNPGL